MSAPRRIRPFPWGSLDVTTRASASALSAMRRWGEEHAQLSGLGAALSALIETDARFLLRKVGELRAATPLEDGVGVLLAPADAPHDPRRAILLEAEGALAATLVARALRRSAPALADGSRPSPAVAGALAAIAAAAARRAHVGIPHRVVAAGSSLALLADLSRASGDDALVASFTVLVGDEAFLARAVLPRAAAVLAPYPRWTKATLRAFGDAPLSIPIVASADAARATDVASLAIGDAWIPRGFQLTRGAGGALSGPVVLAAPSHERGALARLEEIGGAARLVLGGEGRDLAWSPEATTMTGESDTTDALVDAIGEVPVVVRVEIGAAEMPARAWAELGAGDVVVLGRRVADPVVLRVGGIEVARGELVDVEGEVGVRILARTEATTEVDKESER